MDVRPTRGKRPYPSLARLPEEDTMLAPRLGEPHQLELGPLQRVERVGDTESLPTPASIGS